MPRAALLPLVLALAVVPPFANGQQAKVPGLTAEYVAEYRIERLGVVTAGRVYAAPGKERREMTGPSGPLVIIMRHDRRLVWTLMPLNRSYAEMSAAPPEAPAAPPAAVGEDVIEGVRATKYRLAPAAAEGGSGASAAGYVWLTAEGIPIRIEETAVEGERRIAVTVALRNLRIGRQDPALFEIPPGYRKVVIAAPPPAATR
ncbi:MAG: hypothetical protein ACE5JZ_01195 [Kiloniellales bacterium]